MGKRERIDLEISSYDNDASPVIFGFEFQILSAIPLVLSNIKNVDRFVIEGKYNDIEIYYNDDSMAFIQAKAIQMSDSENESVKNNKFISAIISLYSTPFAENEKLIYVSNFKSPIGDDKELFCNNFITYNDCPNSIKTQIDNLVISASNRLTNIIKKMKENGESIKKSFESKTNKLVKRLNDKNNKNSICFYSIYPITENKNLLYQMKPVRDSITTFLSNDIGCDLDKSFSLSASLLTCWHNFLTVDGSISNKSDIKEISKQDFLWPIVVYSSAFHEDVVRETMTGRILTSDIIDAEKHLDESVVISLQMFGFLHKLYKDFNDYRRNSLPNNPEKEFICERWTDYKEKFEDFTKNEIQLEYITKNYLYRLLLDYNCSMKLDKGAKIW